MRKIRDHQLDSPRLNAVEQGLTILQTEIAEARSDQFASLGERLDYITANAGGRGGGAGGGLLYYEEVTPQPGSTQLTLSQRYLVDHEQLLLYYNGMLLTAGADNDYTEVDGRRISLNFATRDGDRFTVVVMAKPQAEIHWLRQAIVGTDGQTDFVLDFSFPLGVNGVQVYKNGILQTEGIDNDYVEVNERTIRMAVPATSQDAYLFLVPVSHAIVSWWRNQIVTTAQMGRRVSVGRIYAKGAGQLQVYRNGLLQHLGVDYVELDNETVEFLVDFQNDETVHFILPESGPGQQVGVLQKQIAELLERIIVAELSHDGINLSLSNVQQRVGQVESEMSALAGIVTQVETALAEQVDQVAEIQGRLGGLEADLSDVRSQITDLATEIANARTPDFGSLAERLEHIMQNAGSGGGSGLISYEEILTPAGLTELTLVKPYQIGQRVILYRNGLLLTAGVDADFEETDGTKLLLHFTTGENDRYVVMIMGKDGGSYGPGTGGSSLLACDEITPPAGSTSFTLPTPYTVGKEKLFLYHNGILLTPGADKDYTTDGTTVTLSFEVEDDDRFVAVIMGFGKSGGDAPAELVDKVLELETRLSKSDFKLEVLRRAYAYYCNEACDVFTDDTGIDQNASTGINYDPNAQVVTSEHGGELVTVEIPTSVSPSQVLLLWEGMNVLAEVSRDNGISYEAIDKDVLTSLSLGQGGTSLRLRFILAPGGALNHWGLIWR